MGMAAMEAAEHDEQWRKMAIEEWGHLPTCAVFNVMGKCDCGRPNRKEDSDQAKTR